MYLLFEREASGAAVKTVSDLAPPGEATHAELQADTQAIRYTMDGVTDPTSSSGMLLLTTSDPKLFLIEDLKRIRFIQGAGGAGGLNVHYLGGRDI